MSVNISNVVNVALIPAGMRLGLGFARQRRDVVPGWVNPDALLAMQFGPDRYWRSGAGLLPATSVLATTRASGINLPNTAGEYQSIDVNELPRTDRGLYANGQHQNVLTARTGAPVDLTNVTRAGDAASTLTIVDATASLIAAGFGGLIDAGLMNGNVYRLDNSAGSSVARALFSATGTQDNRWARALVRGGTGSVNSSSGGITETFGASGDWRWISVNIGNGAGSFRVNADAGQILEVILTQVTDSTFEPPLIISNGSAATLFASDIRAVQGVRPSNGQQEPFPLWELMGLDAGFTFLVDFDGRFLSAGSRQLISVQGSSGFFRLETGSNGLQFRASGYDGTNNVLITSGNLSGGRMRAAARIEDNGSAALARSGSGTVNAGTVPYLVTPQTLSVGSTAGNNPWDDWIYELQICKPLSDAELLDWVNA